jgi:phosphopantetheinyl transferase
MKKVLRNGCIYLLNIENINEKEWKFYHSKLNLLPVVCQKKIRNIKYPQKQRLSLMGWLMFTSLLLERCENVVKPELLFSKEGKPFLKNCKWQFNISHSYPWVCLGISSSSIGIDVECKFVSEPDKVLEIFSTEERNWIQTKSNNNIEKMKYFIRCLWSAKEAWLKYLGTGFLTQSTELPFALEESEPIRQYIKKDRARVYLHQIPVIDGSVLSFCMESQEYHVEYLTDVQVKRYIVKEQLLC